MTLVTTGLSGIGGGLNMKLGLGFGLTIGAWPGTSGKPVANYDPIAALGSDLIEYWDALRGDSITETTDTTYTNVVNSWLGLITGADLVQNTPALKPVYSPAAFNGTPCIKFDGIQQYLTCTAGALLGLLPAGSDPCEMWVLCSQDIIGTDATTRHVVGYADTSVIAGRSLARIPISNVNRARSYTGIGASATVATDGVVDFSGIHVLRGAFGSTVTGLQIDGGAPNNAAAVPATTSPPTKFRVGAIPASAASNWWSGLVAAVYVTKPLSADKVTALQTYLGQ